MTDIGASKLLLVALLWVVAIPSAVVFAPTCDLVVYKVIGNTKSSSTTLAIHTTEPYNDVVERILNNTARAAMPIPKDYEPWFEFFGITVCALVFTTAFATTVDTFLPKFTLFHDMATTTAWLGVIFTVLWTQNTVEYVDANTLTTGQDVEVGSCALVCAGLSSIGSQLVLFLGRRGRK